MSVPIFIILMAILFVSGVPIFVAIGLASVLFTMTNGYPTEIIYRRMFTGIDSTTLLCIPFFILAGDVMAKGGIANRLIDCCKILVGKLRGGLSFVCIFACTIFAAITGSNVACCMALGIILIPAMIKSGYDDLYASAVVAAGSTLGPIIPPSLSMVLYASLASCSLGQMYLGGIPSGLMIAFFLAVVSYIICRKRGYKALEFTAEERTRKHIIKTFIDGIWALGSPVIILGGIFGGVCTPTEASVVAVVYGILVGMFVYKEITWKDLPQLLFSGAKASGRILIIGSAATLFATLLTYVDLPTKLLAGLSAITTNPTVMLLIMMGIIFIMGMFLEPGSIMFITVPLFLPICKAMNIDIVYFGVLVAINASLGCITPPFGTVLYAASYVGRVPAMKLGRELFPFIGIYVVCILLFCLFPQIIQFVF